ncbi:hypothetical protein V8E36_000987 [Tilletia maclaganii]
MTTTAHQSATDAYLASARPGSELPGFSRVRNGRRYELVIVQQPSRARMCGFGDKDRRPLSPTLILKLLVYDAATGRELHPSEVNTSLYFVTSDLCHPDELVHGPRNILVHHAGLGTDYPDAADEPPTVPSNTDSAIHGDVSLYSTGQFYEHPTHLPQPSHVPGPNFAHAPDPTLPQGPAGPLWVSDSSGFLPASLPYGIDDVHGLHPFGMTTSAGIGEPSLPRSSYDSSMTHSTTTPGMVGVPSFPLASGMAGAYTAGDHHQHQPRPPSAGMPGAFGSVGLVGGSSSGPPPPPPPLAPQPQPQQQPPNSVYNLPPPPPPTPTSTHSPPPPTLGSENLTRNLVGSAVASANVLKDLDEKVCIFFVLQDISVRTEGIYRIKLMFADLGLNGTVNRGISEALAETYTDAFVVYSPRKFPGMHDPTELSRKLVSQGVKIPVRSDRKKTPQTGSPGDGLGGGREPSSGPGGADDEDADED